MKNFYDVAGKLFVGSVLAVAVTGCANMGKGAPAESQPNSMSPVVKETMEAHAASAASALRRLAEVQSATQKAQDRDQKDSQKRSDSAGDANRLRAASAIETAMAPLPAPGKVAPAAVAPEPAPAPSYLLSSDFAGLERPLSLDFAGTIEEAVARISMESGWKKGSSTNYSGKPVMVAVSVKNQPMIEILKDLGAQASSSADIVVSVEKKTLSVNYPDRFATPKKGSAK